MHLNGAVSSDCFDLFFGRCIYCRFKVAETIFNVSYKDTLINVRFRDKDLQ